MCKTKNDGRDIRSCPSGVEKNGKIFRLGFV